MCNELKCAIQSTVDLININITRDVQEECANRLYWVCTHSSNVGDGEWWVLQFIRLSPVDVMRLSLGAWWPEDRSSSSVSQFLPSRFWSACQMAVRWKGGYRGDLSPWLFLQLCFCSVWGRCPAERGGQTQRCAQLSARLSAELCSPVLWRYCTTLRCTESIHFLWPLNRKFSGLLVRPWISSAVADGTVFAWLSWPVFECVQSKSGPRRCLHRGTWSCSPSPQGSRWS